MTMKQILINVFAVLAGWIIGSSLNMGLVELGNLVFPIKGAAISTCTATLCSRTLR